MRVPELIGFVNVYKNDMNTACWLQAEFVGFIEHHCIRLLYCISSTVSYRACLDHLAKRSMIVTSSTADRDH